MGLQRLGQDLVTNAFTFHIYIYIYIIYMLNINFIYLHINICRILTPYQIDGFQILLPFHRLFFHFVEFLSSSVSRVHK